MTYASHGPQCSTQRVGAGGNQAAFVRRRDQSIHAHGLRRRAHGRDCARTGLSHGLAYHYFPTKDAIFVAVVETVMEHSALMAENARDADGKPIARLRMVCESMLQAMPKNAAYVLILVEAATSRAVPDRARAVLRRTSRRVQTAFAALIADAQRAGEIGRGDPQMLARTLVAAMSGLSTNSAVGPSSAPLPSADIVLRLLNVKSGS
jgi:AcrR family transcriptional regulator